MMDYLSIVNEVMAERAEHPATAPEWNETIARRLLGATLHRVRERYDAKPTPEIFSSPEIRQAERLIDHAFHMKDRHALLRALRAYYCRIDRTAGHPTSPLARMSTTNGLVGNGIPGGGVP